MSINDSHNEEHADGIVEDRKQAPPIYFNLLFYGLIVWGAIFMGYYLLSDWSSHSEFEEKMAAHTGTPVAEQGTTAEPATSSATASITIDAGPLYASKCAGCHGAKGEGAFGPDLTAGSYKYGRSPEAVRQSIAQGRPKSMPAFADSLTAVQIEALTRFVLDL